MQSPEFLYDPIPIGAAAVRAYYLPVECITCAIPGMNHAIYGHKKAMPNFLLFFNLIQQHGLDHLLHSYDGCYVNRPKRSDPHALSMHAYGAAVDINAATNAQGDHNGDMPPEIVALAMECGLTWGGIFNGKSVDKMHFQKGIEFTDKPRLIASGRPVPAVTYKGVPLIQKAQSAAQQVGPNVKVWGFKHDAVPHHMSVESGVIQVRLLDR